MFTSSIGMPFEPVRCDAPTQGAADRRGPAGYPTSRFPSFVRAMARLLLAPPTSSRNQRTRSGFVDDIRGARHRADSQQRLLYEIMAHDEPTLVAAGLLLLMVALAAAYSPARRASRVVPPGLRAEQLPASYRDTGAM